MLWSTLLKIRKYSVLLKIQIMKKLDVRTAGVSSRIPGTTLHVLFLDYDNIVDERLVEELRYLQEEFELGNFHVLETRRRGRHVVCMDCMRFKDVLEIVRFSTCDLMFKKGPAINEFRSWVLRFSRKGTRNEPKYLYTVESPYEGQNLQSRGHAKYLMKFGIAIDLKKPYGPEEVEIQKYNTGKRTKEDSAEIPNE